MSVTEKRDPREAVRRLVEAATVIEPKAHLAAEAESGKRRSSQLRTVDFGEFMAMPIPPRKPMLGAWLMDQSLNMIHAKRGTGKTHVVLGIAYAVATGTQFLGWKANRPRRVLFVDGELPAPVVQGRLAETKQRTGVAPEPGFFRIITPDLLIGRAAPDLAILEDQVELDEAIGDAELIVLDNLSALMRSGAAENDAESWVTVSDWALRHRAAGRSIIFVHHSGKNGAQRGTSRREDLLDTVISLRQPHDYEASEGARFEVHFEKARHLAGDDVAPVEAQLDVDAPGGWRLATTENNMDERIVELLSLGLSQAEIARELEVNRSTISRRMVNLKEKGVLPADGSPPVVRNSPRNTRQKRLDG